MDLREKAKARKTRENKRELKQAYEKGIPVLKNGTPVARQKIGTPVGNRQRMQAFKEKLLTDENGSKIISKVLEVAMDDDHPSQAACLKMCLDRMLPTSMFEDEKKNSDRPAIQINITGIGESKANVIEGEIIEQS
jgi:hypothetical protein